MQRLLNLSIGVVLLGGCAPGLPPAPSAAPSSAPVHDSLSPAPAGPVSSQEPDAALLDALASRTPVSASRRSRPKT